MKRWLVLTTCSFTINLIVAALGGAVGIPMPWLLALGVSQAGIMWWGTPWALGSALGVMLVASITDGLSLPWALMLGASVALVGALPAWIFRLRHYVYDLARASALVAFLTYGVLLNTLSGALLVTAIWYGAGLLVHGQVVVFGALMWLILSLLALVWTLPILRFGSWRLPLHGIFGTPTALQRSIVKPAITYADLQALVFMLSSVAALGLFVGANTVMPPQIISTFFLLPMLLFAWRRGFDGALLASTASAMAAVGVILVLSPWSNNLSSNIAQASLATIVFQLGFFYLISIMGGLMLDTQRAERRQLATLLDLSRLIGESPDQTTLLDRLVAAVRSAVEASACVISTYDPTTQQLTALAAAPDGRLTEPALRPFSTGRYRSLEHVLQSGEPDTLHVTDSELNTSTSAFLAETGFATVMLIPLVGNAGTLGLIEVFDLRPERRFTAYETQLVAAMGTQTAAAMEQHRLIAALRDRNEQLSAVAQISSVLNATLNLSVVCRHIVRQIARVIPHDFACVALAADHADVMQVVMATNIDTAPLLVHDELPFTALPGNKTNNGTLMRLDPQQMAAPWNKRLLDAELHTILVVPLYRDQRQLGILMLASRRADALQGPHVSLLQMLARHMAVAISNAQLYAELEAAYVAKQEAQEALLQTERLRTLGELASGIAHDFNNLLASILAHTQLLLMDVEDSLINEELHIIEQAARDGSAIVRRMQEFASSRQTEANEAIDLNQIINDVFRLTRPRWNNRTNGVSIEPEIEKNEIPLIIGAAAELREVLINLIFNAIDAMPDGGTLTLRTAVEQQGVVLEVRDTGNGMSADVLANMWTPFFTTKGTRGTGLGLPMIQAIIVQKYGGRISVNSREGHGTTIKLWLPVRDVPYQTAPIMKPQPSFHSSGRILVVESDSRVRMGMERLIQGMGHQVTATDTGDAALRAFAPQRFDILMVDSGITDLSVWELLSTIKQLDPHVRVVLLTIWDTDPGAQNSHLLDAVLPKPFEIQAVRDMLQQLLPISQTY